MGRVVVKERSQKEERESGVEEHEKRETSSPNKVMILQEEGAISLEKETSFLGESQGRLDLSKKTCVMN